jgi:hypothetical protein
MVRREPVVKAQVQSPPKAVVEPKKQFAIVKREIDQEDAINADIQREIERSNLRRTENLRQKEERKIVEHHPRYVESNRTVEEEFNLAPYDRVTNYDLVNRQVHGYQDIDDSYIVKQRASKVANVFERDYAPGTYQVENRRPDRNTRKSIVNNTYLANDYVEPAGAQNRYETSYVQPQARIQTSSQVEGGSSRAVMRSGSGGRIEEELGSGRSSSKKVVKTSTAYRDDGRGVSSGAEKVQISRTGGNMSGTIGREEIVDARKQSFGSTQQLKSATSGQQNYGSKGVSNIYDDDDDDDDY